MANPMYRQIAEDLREQIDSGALKPGQQLQTELELREHYGASRNTVRDAIKWLITLGLVDTKPGQGTFVAQKVDPFVTTLTADPKQPGATEVAIPGEDGYGEVDRSQPRQSRSLSYTDPQIEIQKADRLVADQLQVAEHSQVISRHQRRYIDGIPWSLQTSFYPKEFVMQGASRLIEADDIRDGTVKYLADTLGLRQVGYRNWIRVRSPDVTEGGFFSLPKDGRVGVFEILETAFDQTGTPMRLTVTIFPTDRNQFIVNVGEVPTQPPDNDLAGRATRAGSVISIQIIPATRSAGSLVAHELRSPSTPGWTMAGHGAMYQPEENPRVGAVVPIAPVTSAGRSPGGKKGGEYDGKTACASLQPVPIRALRPLYRPLLTHRYHTTH